MKPADIFLSLSLWWLAHCSILPMFGNHYQHNHLREPALGTGVLRRHSSFCSLQWQCRAIPVSSWAIYVSPHLSRAAFTFEFFLSSVHLPVSGTSYLRNIVFCDPWFHFFWTSQIEGNMESSIMFIWGSGDLTSSFGDLSSASVKYFHLNY